MLTLRWKAFPVPVPLITSSYQVARRSGQRSVQRATATCSSHIHLFFSASLRIASGSQPPAALPSTEVTYTEVLSTRVQGGSFIISFRQAFHEDFMLRSCVLSLRKARAGSGSGLRQKRSVVRDGMGRSQRGFRVGEHLGNMTRGWVTSNHKVPSRPMPQVWSTGFPKAHINMFFFFSSSS